MLKFLAWILFIYLLYRFLLSIFRLILQKKHQGKPKDNARETWKESGRTSPSTKSKSEDEGEYINYKEVK